MLRELHIKNIAVIESITVSFNDGFHALTGETGAGKSILIDSINMALGGRTPKDLIRTGADSASVDMVFEPSLSVLKKLEEMGVDDEDGFVYISRQITVDGKSKCRVNGRQVPLSLLKEISEYLLTIHGQNDNQSILSPKTHIYFVDEYGNHTELLNKYYDQYKKVKDIEEKLSSLIVDETDKERRIDLLNYQINEISSANLHSGEETELEERREYLAHIEQIVENTNEAYDELYGDENREGAFDKIVSSVRSMEIISSFDEKLNSFYEGLSSISADLEDITHELKTYIGRIDYQQGELDMIEDRLAVISDLKRKYGSSVEEILAFLNNAENELSQIENSDATRIALEEELQKEYKVLSSIANELSEAREKTAIKLQTNIMEELADLDMQKMRFSVMIEPMKNDDGSVKYTSKGCDRVEFLISSNPGEELKPLAKIASGGEMSRIMLAIKSILADGDIVETLVFDEIDTGVSGRAAQKIAEKICMLAKERQILCITHLAQIASMADTHFLIEKNSDDNNTKTTVTTLNDDERKNELARIIGGVKVTDLTYMAAQEMLDMAEKLKEKR